jgi:hypothetical protein
MATFGFSIGDFVTCLTLAKNLVEAIKDSTGSVFDFKSLLQTLQALNEAVTHSQIVHLQWEALVIDPSFKKNSLAMINGMEFARQQSKKLLEDFIESLQPYTDVFIKSNGKPVLRNWRKITWHFQKDQSGKLERDLNRHLEALRIYTDALFQYTAGWQFRDILSNVTDLRKEVAHMSSTIQSVSGAHGPARQLSSIENEHQHRSFTLFQHSNEASVTELVPPPECRELDIRELPPLHRAAARGSLREISAHLDRGQNINERLLAESWLPNPIWGEFTFTGCSSLHLASWFGHIKAMELLLDCGANIASEDRDRAQALQYAIYGGNARGAGLLLSRGASLTSQDIWGKRVLHDACINGPLWLIRSIIERGADVFARDNWGMTAFHRAASRGDLAVLKLLVDAGAGPDVHADQGETAIPRAI